VQAGSAVALLRTARRAARPRSRRSVGAVGIGAGRVGMRGFINYWLLIIGYWSLVIRGPARGAEQALEPDDSGPALQSGGREPDPNDESPMT